jgi:hypothetical protein
LSEKQLNRTRAIVNNQSKLTQLYKTALLFRKLSEHNFITPAAQVVKVLTSSDNLLEQNIKKTTNYRLWFFYALTLPPDQKGSWFLY